MAQYWVYLNDAVAGPYDVERLIRLRGFSRQTMVCVDDASGKPSHWISPAEIPELAHIFKAADEHMAPAAGNEPTKMPVKSVSARGPAKASAPAAKVRVFAPRTSLIWPWWLVAGLLAAAGVAAWFHHARRGALAQEERMAQTLIENARLPRYGTLNQYMQEKGYTPRWDSERVQDALYHVTLSWYARDGAKVYAFEANLQAQTIRGINTAAIKLLSEGVSTPAATKPKPAAPKPSPAELFSEALEGRRTAIESGDFSGVWDFFSERKKSGMTKAGMSHEGFIRLQNLTYRVDASVKQTVLKTKAESEKERLVLLKQTQANRPAIFVKQLWVFEDGQWRLDDEEKKAASEPPAPAAPPSDPKPPAASLPGMSN